jgi:hypothetical protein
MSQQQQEQEEERYRGEYRDIWCDHNHRQEFEHELINRKTTWSLTAQTLLFTAYGVSFGIDPDAGRKFRYVVAGAGVALAVLLFIGIRSLIYSKRRSWEEYCKFYNSFAENHLPRPIVRPLQWGVETRNTKVTLFPDQYMPVVFAIAWLIILIIYA